MSLPKDLKSNPDEPQVYEIRLKGQLDKHWANRFEGFSFNNEAPDETSLTGEVEDQAALYHLLRKIRDFGLTLLAVRLIDSATDSE